MNHQPSKFWIGTSGFSYPDWVGPFYPSGTQRSQMLALYARRFPVVELNFSYYRMPSPETFEQMVRKTPDGFQFLVKMSSEITHALQLENIRQFLDALDPLRSARRLAGILCQFPQSFHRTRTSSSYLRQLAGRMRDYPNFIEFRHRSWDTKQLVQEMAALQFGIVSVDVPAIPSLFPRGLVAGGDTIYVRFHSRRVALWYADGKDRYDYLYNENELEDWLDNIQELMADTQRVYLLFNNCQRAQAAQNAEQVRRLLDRRFCQEATAESKTEDRDFRFPPMSKVEEQMLLPIG